jgi:hypothetical protein
MDPCAVVAEVLVQLALLEQMVQLQPQEFVQLLEQLLLAALELAQQLGLALQQEQPWQQDAQK